MANLTPDEKALFATLMARLLEDEPNDDALAEAIEHEADVMAEQSAADRERYAAEDEARREHELAVIDAQADATVRVIEAEGAAMAEVATIDASATVGAADALATIDVPDLGDEPGDTLDAAADVLGELTGAADDAPPAVPILELPPIPAVDEILDDVAPTAQHWWTKPRGRRR